MSSPLMRGVTCRIRNACRQPGTWLVVLLLLGGCVPIPATIEPPRARAGMAGVELQAVPRDLALTRSDLPAGFQLVGEKNSGPEYLALYLRPTALQEEESGGNKLLSVLTSVGVYTNTVAAEQVYREATADREKQAAEEAAMISKSATNVASATFDGAVQGADASEAFRVTYRLMGRNVYEYGHRFRIGNVLAYVVVSAVGEPTEPGHLIEDAAGLVQRQVDHIAQAAGQARPE